MRKTKLQLILGGRMSSIVVQKKESQEIEIRSMSEEKVARLRRQFCGDLTDDEFATYRDVVQITQLNPFMRQIYAVKRKGKMCIQVGIDGYRLIADRTGAYAGSDDPIFSNEDEPYKATVTIYKMIQGQRCPFTASARWTEYYPGYGKESFMWDKMPATMLGKVAEALALRKGFPAELSGIYTEDEMAQAEGTTPEANPRQVQHDPIVIKPAPFQMTQEQRSLLYEAMRVNGYSTSDLTAFTARFKGGVPNSLAEYRATLIAMSQTKPKFSDDCAKEFMQEMQTQAMDEAVNAMDMDTIDRESQRIHDIQSQRFSSYRT